MRVGSSLPDGVANSAPPYMTSNIRSNAVAWAKWMQKNRKNIIYQLGGGHGYLNVSTAKRTKNPPLPLTLDCSSSTSLCLMWGGAKQVGIVGTGIMQGFTRLKKQECLPGDLVLYGPANGTTHVAMVTEKIGNKLICFSHGGGHDADAADSTISPCYVQDNYRPDLVYYVRWPGIK